MWIVGTIVELLFWFLVDVIGYTVARIILPVISFGRIGVAPFDCDERMFSWFGGRRDGDGRMELGSSIASSIGLLICAVYLAAVLWIVR